MITTITVLIGLGVGVLGGIGGGLAMLGGLWAWFGLRSWWHGQRGGDQ